MTSPLPLFRRMLADGWRSLIVWAIGIVAVLSLYLPIYPSLGASGEMEKLLASLPDQLVSSLGYDQIATGTGYTQATFFGLMGFALLTICAVSWGTAAIAGDEENGSLELTLAHGVSRTQLVLERTAAIVARLIVLVGVAVVMILALNGSAELGIEIEQLLGTAAALLGLSLMTATAAIAVGALTGRRAYASAAGAGIAVAGYALNAVSKQTADLEWLHNLSPYWWAYGNEPLTNGADARMLALLFGAAAALTVIAIIGLRRRDVSG